MLHAGRPLQPACSQTICECFPIKSGRKSKSLRRAKNGNRGPTIIGFAKEIPTSLVTDNEINDALRHPEGVEKRFAKYYAGVHGYDSIPQAARLVVQSIAAGYLKSP